MITNPPALGRMARAGSLRSRQTPQKAKRGNGTARDLPEPEACLGLLKALDDADHTRV